MRLPGSPLIAFWLIAATLLAGLAGCQSNQQIITTADTHNTELAGTENARGFTLITTGKYADAEPLVKRAVAADELFGPAHNNLGLIYYHTQRLYPAAWEFETAIKLMPNQPEPRNNLGLVLEQAGKLEEAMNAYEKARSIQPDNPEYVANLARARIQRGFKDADTRALLDEIVLRDSRPQWRHWARMTLFRLRQADPSTRPAPPAKP